MKPFQEKDFKFLKIGSVLTRGENKIVITKLHSPDVADFNYFANSERPAESYSLYKLKGLTGGWDFACSETAGHPLTKIFK
jgi:hypothetical protein